MELPMAVLKCHVRLLWVACWGDCLVGRSLTEDRLDRADEELGEVFVETTRNRFANWSCFPLSIRTSSMEARGESMLFSTEEHASRLLCPSLGMLSV